MDERINGQTNKRTDEQTEKKSSLTFKGLVKSCDFFPEYIHYGSRKSYVSILLTYDPSIPHNNEKKFLLT